MPKFAVNFYLSSTGERPFDAFLNALQDKQKAKCLYYIGLLAVEGLHLSRNYVEKVEDGMWALRPEWGNVEFRLFFTHHKGAFTFVHGIVKKTTKLPEREKGVVRRRIKEWKERS